MVLYPTTGWRFARLREGEPAWHPHATGRAYEAAGGSAAFSVDGGHSWRAADEALRAGHRRRHAVRGTGRRARAALEPDAREHWEALPARGEAVLALVAVGE